ncbi:MAG TPA: hypothetical protein VKP68_13450 [Ramlibacter sp.]|nr:hypothetical protein [Ramlibacter sp.]
MKAGNFVMLRADSLRLLLPQQEVGAAEYIEQAPRALPQPGWFEYGSGEGARPVIALSGQMTPLVAFPADRFVLTRFSLDGSDLLFAWNEVRVLIEAQLQAHLLPPSMRTADGPISGYVERDGEVLLCSTAGQVMAYAAAHGS